MTRIYFGSGNPNKADEVNKIVKSTSVSPIPESLRRKADGIKEIQGTLAEISEQKAHDYANLLNAYITSSNFKGLGTSGILVDDTGFTITEINFPGPYIKDFLAVNSLEKICTIFAGKKAIASVCLTLVTRDTSGEGFVTSFVSEKHLEGRIAEKPVKGEYGFAWDEIFIPDGYDLPISCIVEKNKISPRAAALGEFDAFIAAKKTETMGRIEEKLFANLSLFTAK